MKKLGWKLVVMLCAMQQLQAANTILQLDDVEVNAALNAAVKQEDLTDDVTIVTKAMIEEAHVNTLTEALQRLGGVMSSANGGIGQPTAVYIRGMDSKRTLVLIDGIRVNDVTGLNGAQFEHYSVDSIERIEIIKGAQSGVWGADASAGVINIVTTGAKKGMHAAMNAQYGSFDTKKIAAQLSFKDEKLLLKADTSLLSSAGFSAAEPTQASPEYKKRGKELGWESDAYKNKSINLHAAYQLTDTLQAVASLYALNAYTEYDASAGTDAQNYDDPFGFGTSAYFNTTKNRYYSVGLKHATKKHKTALLYNVSTFNRDQFKGYSGNQQEVRLEHQYNYASKSFVKAGIAYQDVRQDKSGGADLNKSYSTTGLYVTNYNQFEAIKGKKSMVVLSLRYDDYSTFGNKTTGKVGLKQYVSKEYFISTNIGTGYNVPTLYQLYDGFSGNSDVLPETTLSVDATIGSERFWVTGFRNRIENLIDYSFSTYAYYNVPGKSLLQGVEIGYNDQFFDRLALKTTYTYLDARNGNKQRLARRPEQQVDAIVSYFINEKAQVGLNGQYIGARYDKTDEKGAQTGYYTVINLVGNYDVNENFSLYARLDNLTNVYYQQVDGYATAKRSLYAGLTLRY